MLRVSEVLAYHPPPHLVRWEEKKGWEFCEKVREESMAVGTEVDMMVQRDINGVHDAGSTNLEVNNCMKAWRNFIDTDEGNAFHMKSVKYRANMQKELVMGDLMGHPDFIFDDELPDLKTSKSINLSHWMQVAQYAKMWNETIRPPNMTELISKISILRLDKYDERGVWEYKVLGEPFISMLQEKFNDRHTFMKKDLELRREDGATFFKSEEKSFADLMRKKLEEERLL